MGMFDYVRCHYPLPWPEAQDEVWQSKDTPAQYLDLYEIHADGSLWHKTYTQRCELTPDEFPGFRLHQDDLHWARVSDFTHELEIHTGPYSVQFWFRDGMVADAIFHKDESPTTEVSHDNP